ncbi:MAG: CBS domain-containing protein [Rhodanobacteraceae bacterium]|nr:MAG: CBS domain-containing protein [Rhodanobacteraceae bacterium]
MKFHSLVAHTCHITAVLPRRKDRQAASLTEADPATCVMVDFTSACPLTVEPERKIDAALQNMIDAGVRTLLVVEKEHVTGLITAYDIKGQKPLQFLSGSDCIHPRCRHEDIEVGDIMTGVEALPVLRLADVRRACIGDIWETFRETRQTHLLVMDRPDDSHDEIRGLISLTEIERLLGLLPVRASAARIEMEASMVSRVTACR